MIHLVLPQALMPYQPCIGKMAKLFTLSWAHMVVVTLMKQIPFLLLDRMCMLAGHWMPGTGKTGPPFILVAVTLMLIPFLFREAMSMWRDVRKTVLQSKAILGHITDLL